MGGTSTVRRASEIRAVAQHPCRDGTDFVETVATLMRKLDSQAFVLLERGGETPLAHPFLPFVGQRGSGGLEIGAARALVASLAEWRRIDRPLSDVSLKRGPLGNGKAG